MNNSLEHLEQGYFACFHETERVTWEILADLNEVDTTYVETILEAMRKWQADVTLMVTAMHTNDCAMWDANRKAIKDALWDFEKVCEASHIKHAKDHEAHQKAHSRGPREGSHNQTAGQGAGKDQGSGKLSCRCFSKAV